MFCTLYEDESKVLQYFGNMRRNLAALDAFTEVMTVTKHTVLWNFKLLWYPQSATNQICVYSLDHSFSESIVLGLLNLGWSLRFLQPKQNFLNHLITVLTSTVSLLFTQQMFLLTSTVLWATWHSCWGVIFLWLNLGHRGLSP